MVKMTIQGCKITTELMGLNTHVAYSAASFVKTAGGFAELSSAGSANQEIQSRRHCQGEGMISLRALKVRVIYRCRYIADDLRYCWRSGRRLHYRIVHNHLVSHYFMSFYFMSFSWHVSLNNDSSQDQISRQKMLFSTKLRPHGQGSPLCPKK